MAARDGSEWPTGKHKARTQRRLGQKIKRLKVLGHMPKSDAQEVSGDDLR